MTTTGSMVVMPGCSAEITFELAAESWNPSTAMLKSVTVEPLLPAMHAKMSVPAFSSGVIWLSRSLTRSVTSAR